MTDSDKLLLFALEAARPDQIDALLEIARDKGVPLAEIIQEAIESGITKELENWDDEDGLL